MSQNQVWVIIAAYNEELTIRRVIEGIKIFGFNVLVVDDGSSDTTGEQSREAGAIVVRHPFNLGQGAALQTGLDFALLQDAQYLVTFDADGQHNPSEIVTMLKVLRDSGADIVCGSRFLGSAIDIPTRRKLLLKLGILFTKATSGVSMTDVHNGFRVMTASCAKKIKITQNRMAHASEFITIISSLNLKYKEAPVTIIYTKYSLQKGQKISGSIRILSDLIFKRLN